MKHYTGKPEVVRGMRFKRCRIMGIFVVAALLSFLPVSTVAAGDITGNTYFFSATWSEQSYIVDDDPLHKSSLTGDFQLTVQNITASDAYEYRYLGANYHSRAYDPYFENRTDSVYFQDNKVSFDLSSVDEDADNTSESFSFEMTPHFEHHHPGHMFFVNPVWSTHNTEWNSAVQQAENNPTVSEVSDSIGDGTFSLQIVVNTESSHELYGAMNGTATIVFDASYDDNGVLSEWQVSQTREGQNENHTLRMTFTQQFARSSGGDVVLDSGVTTLLGVGGAAAVGGLIIGALAMKKYYS